MIETRLLQQFIVVAEELHFGRAAQRLSMTQPPLSQAIQRLERELGVMLFERTKRRVQLTSAGQALLQEAHRLMAQSERAVTVVQQIGAGESGRLTVGFVSAALYRVLPPTLRAFRAQYPYIESRLLELPTNDQIKGLHSGELDIGFIHPPIPDDDDLAIRHICRDPLMVALPADHALANKPVLQFEDLRSEVFVLFPASQGPNLHAAIERACHTTGFTLRVAQEAHRMHTILSLVAAGLGVSLVPTSTQSLHVDGVVYRDVADLPSSLFLELGIMWYQHRSAVSLAAFIEFAVQFGASGS